MNFLSFFLDFTFCFCFNVSRLYNVCSLRAAWYFILKWLNAWQVWIFPYFWNPLFCVFSKTCHPARRFILPPRFTLWVSSPVDVTTAKGAGQEVCLTPWPSPCSAVKMKTEVTEANRRCEPSINHKLMSHRKVRNIFCC